ncbi:MAG: undecaprenyl-diphosphate phosphatase [Oscillospiraceae bacterium]
MSFASAVFLGFIQGVAEFLPISSSGHLSILQNLFGLNTAEEGHMFFDVLLHFGTLISVCVVYWSDIAMMIHEFFAMIRETRHPEEKEGRASIPARRMILLIIVATLPLVAVLPIDDAVESLYYNTFFIGTIFLLTGFMLFVSDKLKPGSKTEKSMRIRDALIIGLCQCVAVIPGLSRSGTTITAGIATGLDRSFAVKFAFLMSIPAIIGANIISLVKALMEGIDGALIPIYLVGMVTAAITGILAIGLVKLIASRGKFGVFAYYCWTIGIATIILSLIF